MVLGLVRSPIGLEIGAPNEPLDQSVHESIGKIGKLSGIMRDRYSAIKQGGVIPSSLGPLKLGEEKVELPKDAFDDLHDLLDPKKSTLVFVSISGGGARASLLAADTLAYLEEVFNNLVSETSQLTFFQAIDAYSSVSGGSIYSYYLASTLIEEYAWQANEEQYRENNLAEKRYAPRDIHAKAGGLKYPFMARAGMYSASSYLSPFNGFVGPIMTFFTERSYLDWLGMSLHLTSTHPLLSSHATPTTNPLFYEESELFLSKYEKFFGPFKPGNVTLGMIGDSPRFFFNATLLEIGSPFVITQRILHLPSDKGYEATSRLDLNKPSPLWLKKPLGHAFTLEEINSSPARFPLAYAAVASAAFPIGMEPMGLRVYGYDPNNLRMFPTNQLVRLADGGVWDNSGMTTLVDFYEHIVQHRPRTPPNLILIAINAETEIFTRENILDNGKEQSFLTKQPIRFNLPLRFGSLGKEGIDLIHFTNKRRAEQMAFERISRLLKDGATELGLNESNVYYFPINLSQLSPQEKYPIELKNQEKQEELFEKVKKIKTHYTLDPGDSDVLKEAAKAILRTEQKDGWKVGLQCDGEGEMEEIFRIDLAVAYAILRSHLGWPVKGHHDPLQKNQHLNLKLLTELGAKNCESS